MPIPGNVYRGDSRDPETLERAGGFSAWSPLDAAEAREMLELFTKLRAFNQCSFATRKQKVLLPDVVTQMGDSRSHTPDSLKELIIRSGKSHDTFWVSTETTQGGGGMGGRYIYQIPTGNLQLVSWTTVNPALSPKAVWPELYMDSANLATASVIALFNPISPTKELSFLTGVTCAQIHGWKTAASGENAAFTPTTW